MRCGEIKRGETGLISFRMDWLDLLAVQGTLKTSPTPQFKSINSSVSAFFIVQLSHPYMTTGKTIALTRWTFALDSARHLTHFLSMWSMSKVEISGV